MDTLYLVCTEFLKRIKVSISHHTDTPDWKLISYISYIYNTSPVLQMAIFVKVTGLHKHECSFVFILDVIVHSTQFILGLGRVF